MSNTSSVDSTKVLCYPLRLAVTTHAMEESPLSDTPEARLRLTRILSHELFKSRDKRQPSLNASGELLKALADVVFQGSDPPQRIEDVPVKRLNDRLEKYFNEETGKFDPEVWRVRQRTIVCTLRESWDVYGGPSPSSWYTRTLDRRSVDLDPMRDFLTALCASDHTAAAGIDETVEKWARANDYGDIKFDRPGKALDVFFDFIKLNKRRLSFQQFVRLAWQLRVHRVALDHLLSEPIGADTPGLKLRVPGPIPYALREGPNMNASDEETEETVQFHPAGEAGEEGRGTNSQYWIPERRLEDNVAFVYLILAQGGHSDHHHHAGEELQFVIKGTIRTTFSDSGVECVAKIGTFTHFYSEQNHIIHNVGDDFAEVLIIRFYPSSPADTRHDVRGRLWTKLTGQPGSAPEAPVTLDANERLLLLEEAASRARPYDIATGPPPEISDRLGFVRLLSGRAPSKSKWQAFRKAEKISAAEPADWLWSIATYRASVTRGSLARVAELYNRFNLLLLGYLFPSDAPTVVVQRGGRDSGLSLDWMPLATLAKHTDFPIPAFGVHYEIPTRSLTYSNAEITWIKLDPGATTSSNKHDGSELLVPLSGDITIRFFEDEKGPTTGRLRVSRARRELAHFRSSKWHAVVNTGSTLASVFVIRINEPARAD